MALKRIVRIADADQKTYEKLRLKLDVIGPGHPSRGRIQKDLNAAKARIAARQ